MKIYITFGQRHIHKVNETVFDCNSVAEIECESYEHGRSLAFEYFGPAFAFSYDSIDELNLRYYDRGIIPVASEIQGAEPYDNTSDEPVTD